MSSAEKINKKRDRARFHNIPYMHFICIFFSVLIIIVTLYFSVQYTRYLESAKAITELKESLTEKVNKGEEIEGIDDIVFINTGLKSARRVKPNNIEAVCAIIMDGKTYRRKAVSLHPKVFVKYGKKRSVKTISDTFKTRHPEDFYDEINDYTDLNVGQYVALDVQSIIRLVDQVIFFKVNVKPEEVPLINEQQRKIAKELHIDNVVDIAAPGVIELNGLQAAAYANLGVVKGTYRSKGFYFRRFMRAALRGFRQASNEDIISTRGILGRVDRSIGRRYLVEFMARIKAFQGGPNATWPKIIEKYKYKGDELYLPVMPAENSRILHEKLQEIGYKPSKNVKKKNKTIKELIAEIKEYRRKKAEEKRRAAEEAARKAAEEEAERQRLLEEQERANTSNDVEQNKDSNKKSEKDKSDFDKKNENTNNKQKESDTNTDTDNTNTETTDPPEDGGEDIPTDDNSGGGSAGVITEG